MMMMRVACEKDPLCPTGISPVKGEKAGAVREDPLCPTGISPVKGEKAGAVREDPLCPTGISPVKGEKAGAVGGAEEAWLRFVEPLREEQTGWQDVCTQVCRFRSGPPVFLPPVGGAGWHRGPPLQWMHTIEASKLAV